MLAVEWVRYGINVNGIAPGIFSSEMMDGMVARVGDMTDRLPRKRMGDAAQLDSTLLYLSVVGLRHRDLDRANDPVAVAEVKRLLISGAGRELRSRYDIENTVMRTTLRPKPMSETFASFLNRKD